MVRKSKRKPRKSFIDEDDPDENSNSTAETDLGEREGEEENGGQNCSGDKIGGGAQQGDVLLPRLQIEQEQISRRVNWGAKGDGRNMLMKPNMEERGESKAGEEEFNRSLNEFYVSNPSIISKPMFSLDVKQLFTNVPVLTVLDFLHNKFVENGLSLSNGMSINTLIELV